MVDTEVAEDTGSRQPEMKEITDEVSRYFLGDIEVLQKILSAVISSGHVLLQDFPGTGKTFLAKLLSHVLGISYRRIQFTPDLLPSDIIGTKIWKQATSTFEIEKGPIFANLILADEINRAPPKTQAALLEAMEEKQVTLEGETILLPRPFIVIATQNPVEFEGTYPLPEAQLDRFMIQSSIGYPEDEKNLLKRRLSWKSDDPSSEAQVRSSPENLLAVQKKVETQITVSDEVLDYIASFTEIRSDDRVVAGPSPRGIISLLRMARGYAYVNGRDFVVPDDVKSVAADTLSHRLVLKPELTMEEVDNRTILKDYLDKLSVKK